jgi:hypothetical protein
MRDVGYERAVAPTLAQALEALFLESASDEGASHE